MVHRAAGGLSTPVDDFSEPPDNHRMQQLLHTTTRTLTGGRGGLAFARSNVWAFVFGLIWVGVVCAGLGGCASMNSRTTEHGDERGLLLRTVEFASPHTKRAHYAVWIPPSPCSVHSDSTANPDRRVPCEGMPGIDHGWPMIVFLNGSGECGTDGVRQTTQGLLPAVLNKPRDWPFVIVFPQKPESDSEWEDHEAMVLAAIEQTQREVRIDPRRIYLTGLSQGGHGTWMIASRHPRLFAAIAPVCGYGPGGFGVEPDPQSFARVAEALASANTPVWAFHGVKDDVVPSKQTDLMIEALLEARTRAGSSAEIRKTLYPDLNHGCWDRAYREGGPASDVERATPAATNQTIAEWFLTHRR